ncbi:MAG: hypothetical protein E7641_01140 [Ruminococcaceae bacterium]|nr:hypothetical protein [Oscillospiraceae bacterium]
MGMFDAFRKKEKTNQPLTALKIGDWVTQYSAGYWKVVAIFPKYADEDYSYNGLSWKKGDRLGDWVVLKKGFTPKMKPSNACEFLDAKNCQPVSHDTAMAIEAAFAENPKAKEKFDKSPNLPNPSVYSVRMSLSDDQADSFAKLLSDLPERYTSDEFWERFADYKQYIVKPPHYTHILYLYSYLWEINDHFDPLHFGAEIKKNFD